MKKMYLDEFKKILKIDTKSPNCIINNVTDDIKKINNNTIVFHKNKATQVNEKKLEKLDTCFIITDQPLLNHMIQKDKYIFVPNIETAYDTFINYYRLQFSIPVVAVTGTCGKTTTKEMISQVLKNNYKVVHTISSKNSLRRNHDYLMSFDEKTEYGVFETAITHPGHLIKGCDIYKPTIGVITTIGIDHLNWCKTLDNYIRTKAEILVGLKNKGILIINNDDDNIKKIDMSNYEGKIVTFGVVKQSDFFGENIQFSDGGMNFNLLYNNKPYPVFVPGYGKHNVYNALAALACLSNLGMNIYDSIYYLKKYVPIKSHNEVQKGINGSTIIDDTWSSNPTSTKAALKVLKELGKNKTRIAVFGKISYLGKYEDKYYQKIAKMLMKYKVNILITQDMKARRIGNYAAILGMKPSQIIHCNDIKELKNTLLSLLNKDTMALFKCSMLDKSNQIVLKSIIVA